MSLFGNTVASITAGLARMVEQLDAHEKAMWAKSHKHKKRADEELTKSNEAVREADRASKVASKIGELLK